MAMDGSRKDAKLIVEYENKQQREKGERTELNAGPNLKTQSISFQCSNGFAEGMSVQYDESSFPRRLNVYRRPSGE